MKISFLRWLGVLAARTPRRIEQYLADRRLRGTLKQAQPFALAEMPENTLGRVVGMVRPLEKQLIEAPLSGRLCVYYDVTIEPQHGEDSTSLRVLASERDAIPFVLQAGEARAVIDPAHAQLSVAVDYFVRWQNADARARVLLDRHGLGERTPAFADGWICREAILEADETITIVGAGVREADPDAPPTSGGYRDNVGRTRLRLTGSARFPLIISDDPRSR